MSAMLPLYRGPCLGERGEGSEQERRFGADGGYRESTRVPRGQEA